MDNATLTPPQALSRALSAHGAGRLGEAEQLCQGILASDGNHFAALHLLAIVQSALGNKAEALASYDRALELRGDHPEVLSNRGVTLHQLERFEDALASYDRALAVRPDYAEALSNRGNTLRSLNRFDEAVASYERAIVARPDHVTASCNRGATLLQLGRLDKALASFDYALTLAPNHAEALSNRGITLHRLSRFEEALASYDRALTARPNYAEALCNRGVTLHEMRRFDDALESYAQALAARPDYAEAHFNEGLSRALIGDYQRGLQKFEWRWRAEQRDQKRDFRQPLWLGTDDIAGKTILIHAEQGFGDTVQFARYVPMVAARGARVILAVQRPLRRLMESLGGATDIVARGEKLPAFDLHCPLLSLPLAFGTRPETIPSATPYLHASSADLARWKERLGPRRRPLVGLTWSGGPTLRHRSTKLKELLPLLDSSRHATFVGLQKEIPPEDLPTLTNQSSLLHFGHEFSDFADTAAVIAQLDLVISVDTAIAHLAGALAKPVWVLLPYVPDWRWGLDRNDCPWYPSARLFRQDECRAWDRVVARLDSAVRELSR
jgi:tetratricopeptide (TPR) repeat protein